MRKRIMALAAAFCLLCGCSDFDGSKLADYLTREESQQEQTTPQPEEQPEETQQPDDLPQQEMASETVLEGVETLETLHLAYQPSFGLHPYSNTSLNNKTVLCLLYEPLFVVNGSFEAEPVLAQSVAVSDDGLTAVITLRSDVRFHSGSALTAGDVLYSYEQAKESTYYSSRFFHVTGFTAQEDGTILVTTDTGYESVAMLLDFPIIRQGTAVQDIPDGTGPFIYDKTTTLKPFARWWGEGWALPYEQVELTVCDTSADIRDQFEYGNVNLVCTDPNAPAYAAFHSDNELWSCPTTLMQYIGFNLDSDIYENSAIRAAITYAINRETIVAQELGGFAVAATLPASPLAACYDAGLAADYQYNLRTFRTMLDEAQVKDYTEDGILDVYVDGYPETVGGKLIVSAASTQRVLTATRIAEELNELGFGIEVSVLDERDFRTALQYGRYDLYYGEVRLSANFDLGPFFRIYGPLAFGDLNSSMMETLCNNMLENSGNAYDLHKQVMEKGYLCPILFKSYAVYTTRGAADELSPGVDWVLH